MKTEARPTLGWTREPDTVCPHCHGDSGVARAPGPTVVGDLRLDEFEVLVRNEWRRRLGPSAYVRVHPGTIIRILARYAAETESPLLRAELESEIWRIVSELRSRGAGRREVRREFAKLAQAIRTVLRDAGAEKAGVRAFTAPARATIDSVLDYPEVEVEREGGS